MLYLLIAARRVATGIWKKPTPWLVLQALDGWLSLDDALDELPTGTALRGEAPTRGAGLATEATPVAGRGSLNGAISGSFAPNVGPRKRFGREG